MDSDMKAVKQYYEQVACPLLPGRRIGLLHGKMKPKDKDEVMQQVQGRGAGCAGQHHRD